MLTLAGLLCCSGCISWQAPVVPPQGALFTQYRAPLTVPDGEVPVCTKMGEHSTQYAALFWPSYSLAWDYASIQKAAEQGGLKKVYYADYEVLAILGIYGKFTVRAYGE